MTLRMTTVPDKNKTTIRVEGHFSAKEVEDLQKEIQRVGEPVHLDLSGLQSADAEGVRTLRFFSAQGVKLVGASPYIQQLLNDKSP